LAGTKQLFMLIDALESRTRLTTMVIVLALKQQKLDGTRRAAVDGYASACCDLWPFDSEPN